MAIPSRPPPRNAEPRGGFRFHNIDHPDKLKDKSEVQKNRRHVMHDWIAKESLKPMSTDMRATGLSHARKRRRSIKSSAGVSDNSSAPIYIFTQASYPSPASTQGNGISKSSADQTESLTWRSESANSPETAKRPSTSVISYRTTYPAHEPSGVDESSRRHTFPKQTESPLTRMGGPLNPFDTWPKFSDPSLDISELKWDCSRRFGSRALGQYWVPTLLRARHAFLSTVAISTAHDDLMSRALQPAHLRSPEGSLERLRVRQEVMAMINESLDDPELKTADATIIAVLQLLNAEIMGCDDNIMRIHQKGLQDMVRQRGGLGKLGVHGQLASILSITNYMIGVLRETAPHADYVNYAAKQTTKPTSNSKAFPESPLYHRRCGYLSINKTLAPSSETFHLLEQTRLLIDAFVTINNRSSDKKLWTPTMPSSFLEDSRFVSDLTTTIFAFRPAEQCSFREMSDRYTYEAIRLTSRIYAHALARCIPLSEAAAQLRPSTPPPSTSTRHEACADDLPLHVRVRTALMRTDLAECWGHLAGVLFWISLVAGAAANPQSSAVVGGYVVRRDSGDDEEARKWLAAIAVRCSIVLSFQYGGVMLETLKRMIAIQDVLAKGNAGASIGDPLFVEKAAVVGVEGSYGPSEPLNTCMQRGFADFAQELLDI